jgi:hypothetical protein
MVTGKTSFVGVASDIKAELLGPEFRNIDVLDFEVADGVCLTRIVLDGKAITLVGNPQEALTTFLDGRADQAAQ